MRLTTLLYSLVLMLMQVVVSTQAIRSSDELPLWARVVIVASGSALIGFTALFAWVATKPPKKTWVELPEATVDYVDPLAIWCQENQAIIQQYPNCHLAVSPTVGVIAHGRTDDEFSQALKDLGDNVPEDTVLCHYEMLISRPVNTVLH
jgi:hypothetical protein